MFDATASGIEIHYVYNHLSVDNYNENQDEDYPDIVSEQDLDVHDIEFTTGSLAELHKLVRLIVCLGPESQGLEGQKLEIYTGSRFIKCDPGVTNGDKWDDSIIKLIPEQEELVQVALRLNTPMGEVSVYNDNFHDARPIAIRFNLDSPSMHERAEARGALRSLLALQLSQEDMDRLIPVT